LGGFNLGGESISGSEEEFTSIVILGIGSDTEKPEESQTTYSIEEVVSEAVLTTTAGGSIIADTLVPGSIMTQIDTLVEDGSGYYISYSTTELIENDFGTSSYIQDDYETCSFSGAVGGCSDSDYLIELPTSGGSVVTSFHSGSYSGTLVATTMTLPLQAVTTSSVSEIGNSTGQGSAHTTGSVNGNGGVSRGKLAKAELCLVVVALILGAVES